MIWLSNLILSSFIFKTLQRVFLIRFWDNWTRYYFWVEATNLGHIAHTFCNILVAVLKPEYLILKVTYDEETEEWNICRTSTLFYQIIKLRSVDFKFKLDTEFDEVYRVTPKELFIIFIFEFKRTRNKLKKLGCNWKMSALHWARTYFEV